MTPAAGAAFLCVTGTDTGVGKTIVTAALASAAKAEGRRVIMVKPVQTGLAPGEESDAEVVARLAGIRTLELARYPDPLAPLAAARVANLPALQLDHALAAIRDFDHDVVLIEGAGGLLVPIGEGGWTLADLAEELGARCVVVARAGLGTLNHTALTLAALADRGLSAQVVIGAWPRHPELVHHANLEDLPPLAGVLPEGAGTLSPAEFRSRAREWLVPLILPTAVRTVAKPGTS
jgi:dethiobiotin synthetase